LLSREAILYIEYKFRQDKQRLQKIRANTYVDFMQLNIVLFNNSISSLSKRKIKLID